MDPLLLVLNYNIDMGDELDVKILYQYLCIQRNEIMIWQRDKYCYNNPQILLFQFLYISLHALKVSQNHLP